MTTAYRHNLYNRPYDKFIPSDLLVFVRKRRHTPNGFEKKVTQTVRAGQRCNKYPWDKMQIGDFFYVDLTGKSERAVRVGLHQAASRLDLELAIRPWKLPNGNPGLRVIKVLEGVSVFKKAAISAGVNVRIGPGKYTDRKRDWAKHKYGLEHGVPVRPDPKLKKSKRRKPDLSNPFWADDEDVSLEPQPEIEPEVKLTREEAIRRALGQS